MNPVVTIEMANGDVIKAELYPEIAPNTVNNFIALIKQGFYDGLIFHRVIPGFMIQGGCPSGTGMGGPGYNIQGEFTSNGVKNDLIHTRGVLSMARSMMPNSAGSQFFIVHKDSEFLDGNYAGFGLVMEGIEVVDKIAEVETDAADKPVTPVVIKSAKVLYNNDEEIEAFIEQMEENSVEIEGAATTVDEKSTVYVTTKTKTYHYSSDCTKVNSAKAMTLEAALAKKYTPCEECVK